MAAVRRARSAKHGRAGFEPQVSGSPLLGASGSPDSMCPKEVLMPGEPPATNHGSKRGPLFLVAGLLLLAGVGVAGGWLLRRYPPAIPPTAPVEPPDPRRAYTGRYRNIDPDIKYV